MENTNLTTRSSTSSSMDTITPKIFTIGAGGLVGSRIVSLLASRYDFTSLRRVDGIDITDAATLDPVSSDTSCSIVLHFAAKTDVDGCERDKEQDIKILEHVDAQEQMEMFRNGKSAWAVNVAGTQNVVDACKKGKKKIIFISTDFVFDGKKSPHQSYAEEDVPRPSMWYGETKYKAEEVVKNSGLPYLILRIAYPYGFPSGAKKDFVGIIAERLESNQRVNAISDHLMTPTFLDDIAAAIDLLIEKQLTGIYHVVGSQHIDPYHEALRIAQAFHFDSNLVHPVKREDFFRNRAPRPFNLSLNNGKIQHIGARMRTFEEGLKEIARIKSIG